MPSISRPEWRYRDILRMLGTAEEIGWRLFGAGYQPPPHETIQGWKTRNSVPGKWVPVLIKIAFDEGLIANLDDLKLRERNGTRKSLRNDPARSARQA